MVKNYSIAEASREELAQAAAADKDFLESLIDATAGDNRLLRQRAAGGLAQLSEEQPDLLVPYLHDLVDALFRPEAKTRWEALEALANLIPTDARMTEKSVVGAESSLYDEESGPARLAAFKYLALYGGTTENRSNRVWPLLDEAIQCYHGDLEFQDMLNYLLIFAQGKISASVKRELANRMKFDADNGRGLLARKARLIIEASKGKK